MHGERGTVIAMIKGTKAEDVCRYLMKLPEGKRKMVKNVTLDMAGSMRQIAKRCFPKATQIKDRFHVQRLMQEALQGLRIQYRWQAIEQENLTIKRAKTEGRKYTPPCFDNGDTMRQLLVRSRYLLFKSPEKWTKSQRIRAEIFFKEFDDIQ